MASIELEQVSKRYPGGVEAVRGVNLSVDDGELMVLVGPSGCGKSTMLRLVAGLEQATEGTVRIGGHRVNDMAPGDRNLAMVFQDYALYPHMTVYRNIAFALKPGGLSRPAVDARVRATAQLLGMDALLHKRPRQLSGGERQRVALGRAIVRQPGAFLMDEPLSNLDAKLRVQTRTELRRLHEQLGTTFLYVTHDQVEAMTLGDRVAVVSEGQLQQVATPRQLYAEPANTFVAGFIGSPPVNLCPVTVSGGSARIGPWIVELPPLPTQEVVLGLRPESFTDERSAYGDRPGPTSEVGSVLVEAVEPLGATVLVHFRIDGTALIAAVDARTTARPGERMPMRLRACEVLVFEAASGRRLLTVVR